MKFTLKAALLATLVATSAHADQFTGQSVDQVYDYPLLGTAYYDPGFTTVNPTGPTFTTTYTPTDNWATTTFTVTQIIVTYDATSSWVPVLAGFFNGIDWQFPGLTILSATLDASTSANFAGAAVTDNSSNVFINWQGIGFVPGNQVVIDVTTQSPTPAPEPATIALLAAGLLGFGAARRKKSQA